MRRTLRQAIQAEGVALPAAGNDGPEDDPDPFHASPGMRLAA
jgi:hypothetical protein